MPGRVYCERQMMKATRTANTIRTRRQAKPSGPSRELSLEIDEGSVREIADRLARVEGQVRAVQRMLHERRDCHSIVQQLGAARTALERATAQLMVTSLVQCVRSAKGPAEEADIQKLMETFTKLL